MPTIEAIKSVAVINAGILGMANKIDLIEVGKLADIVAVVFN